MGKTGNIGVFFGGCSPEHDVSIITGQLIISELKKMRLDFTPIYVSKKGEWFIGGGLDELKFFKTDRIDTKLLKLNKYYIDLEKSQGRIVFKKKSLAGKEITIDTAFPAFHGLNGEDGTIQGLFEIFNIPYIGCGVASSAISIDKILTKMFYKSIGIPTTKFIYFNRKDWNNSKNDILRKTQKLGFPLFVKPSHLGSSIAITKVTRAEELENACEVALHYDNAVLVEIAVENLADITCAVLGNDKPEPSLLQESVFNGEHFSYEDKYLNDGGAQLGENEKNIIIPANISNDKTEEVQKMSIKIFKMLGCSGIARVDFLYDRKNEKIYANEINTMPGTLYHHLWKKSGLELNEIILKLIKLSKERNEEKNNIESTFNSRILEYADSIKLQMIKSQNNTTL